MGVNGGFGVRKQKGVGIIGEGGKVITGLGCGKITGLGWVKIGRKHQALVGVEGIVWTNNTTVYDLDGFICEDGIR